MKRRTKWILAWSGGGPVLLIAGALLVLWLSSPSTQPSLADIEVKDLPDIWEQQLPEPESADVPVTRDREQAAIAEPNTADNALALTSAHAPSIEAFGLPFSGVLVMMSGDKPFGEESFQLSLEDGGVALRSSGRFWFKALVATITLKYEQELHMDSFLRPVSLESTFDAPLGFGMAFQAEFADGKAVIRSGKDAKEVAVDLERAFVLGTFGTYAAIPLLYELRGYEGDVALDTLVFGGPPHRETESDNDELPQTTIARIEDTTLRYGDRQLAVSQYLVSGSMGSMVLFVRGAELLGMLAGSAGESLLVYRADYFQDGFTVAE